VYVVGDDPNGLSFSIAVDDHSHVIRIGNAGVELVTTHGDQDAIRRRYITAAIRVRLHQRAFRERVIEAYRRQCAFCRLRHEELLDAAHIVPDAHPEGEPVVSNGLSLCSLHHAAFDRSFLGVRPDYVIEVRPDILLEKDGPTLVHAIQALHGTQIQIPAVERHRPNPSLLEMRYEKFRQLI
jgi:putative restriction endonuclease